MLEVETLKLKHLIYVTKFLVMILNKYEKSFKITTSINYFLFLLA